MWIIQKVRSHGWRKVESRMEQLSRAMQAQRSGVPSDSVTQHLSRDVPGNPPTVRFINDSPGRSSLADYNNW